MKVKSKIANYVLGIFFMFVFINIYGDDFDKGIRTFNDGMNDLALEYFKGFLNSNSKDLDKKVVSQFYIAFIYSTKGEIDKFKTILPILFKKKEILKKYGVLDTLYLLKAYIISNNKGIKEAIKYLKKKILKKEQFWKYESDLIRFYVRLKNNDVLREIMQNGDNLLNEKTFCYVYLFKASLLLAENKSHEAYSLLNATYKKNKEIINKTNALYSFYYALLGEAEYQMINYKKAIIDFKMCLESKNFDFVDKYLLEYKLALAYWKNGEYISSKELLNEFIKKRKWDENILFAKYILAEIYKKTNEFNKAENILKDLLNSLDKSNDLYYKTLILLSDVYFNKEDYSKSVEISNEIIKSDKIEYKAKGLYNKFWALYKFGKYKEAINVFNELIKINKNDKIVENTRAAVSNIYYLLGQYSNAIKTADLVKGENINENLSYLKGLCYMELENYEKAIDSFEFSAKSNDKEIAERSLYNIAQIYIQKRNFQKAIFYLKQIMDKYKNGILYYRSMLDLGRVYYNIFDYKKAIELFEKTYKESKEEIYKTKALYYLGWCFYMKGDEKETIKIFKEYLKNYPSSRLAPDIQFWLGEYFYNKGNMEKALFEYENLIKHYPDCSFADDAIFWSAKINSKLEKRDKAEILYNKIINEYKKSDFIVDAYMELAEIYAVEKNYDKAIDTIEKFLNEYPKSIYKYDMLVKKAKYYKLKGDNNEAIKIISLVLGNMRSRKKQINPKWLFDYAVLLRETKRNKESLDVFLEIIYKENYLFSVVRDSVLEAVEILEDEGKYEDAVKLLEKLLADKRCKDKKDILKILEKLKSKMKERVK